VDQPKKSNRRWIRWVVVLLMLVALAAAAIPDFVKTRATSCANACVNNLRQIDAAAIQFADDHGLTNGAPIRYPDDLTPYIKLNSAGKIPPCPDGGTYHIDKVGGTVTCSLGSTTRPTHVLPTGW
jgi:type II secretory pathway pseudopilin PulG